MNPRELFQAVALRDVVSEPTEQRPEGANPFAEAFRPAFNESDFESPAFDPIDQPSAPEPIQEEFYDAEQNARSLVNTLAAIDGIIMNSLVIAKCRKKHGGKKGMSRMKAAMEKRAAGLELSDLDKQYVAEKDQYMQELKALSDDMSWRPEKLEQMIQAAIPYCEATKISMGPGSAFWITYAGYTAERAMKLLVS